MKLDASNLGQIIGRLMYAADEAPAATTAVPDKPIEPPKRKKGRMAGTGPVQRAVLELLKTRTNLSANEIAVALKISIAHSTVMLCKLHDARLVKRVGERHGFRYSLPG